MFSLKSFKIRSATTYPQFSQVVQSWHSPLVGSKPQEDAGYSACVTLGVAPAPSSKKRQVFLISVVNGQITNPLIFRKHIKCLSEDYLNKTDEVKNSLRRPDVVVFESKKGDNNQFLASLTDFPIDYFCPEYNGGELLDNRIIVMMPHLERLQLTKNPVEPRLRTEDAELVGILSAYPSPESYAVTSAFVQAMLYLVYTGAFEESDPKTTKKNSYGFY